MVLVDLFRLVIAVLIWVAVIAGAHHAIQVAENDDFLQSHQKKLVNDVAFVLHKGLADPMVKYVMDVVSQEEGVMVGQVNALDVGFLSGFPSDFQRPLLVFLVIHELLSEIGGHSLASVDEQAGCVHQPGTVSLLPSGQHLRLRVVQHVIAEIGKHAVGGEVEGKEEYVLVRQHSQLICFVAIDVMQ